MSSVTGAAGPFAGMGTSPDEGAGTGLGKSVSAWRRVFEREQMAALAKFRSVATGSSEDVGAYSTPPRQPVRTEAVSAAAVLPPSGQTGRLGGGNVDIAPGTPAHHASFSPTGAKPSMPAGERWAGLWLRQALSSSPAKESMQSLHALTAPHLTAPTTPGEWPWRKMHCMVKADGVHVWLRDTAIGAGDTLLLEWIKQLHQMLAQSGMRLASFTLNGVAISPVV